MALIIADRVKETTTTTGTGAISLAGAATNFRAFSSVMSNADTTYYAIIDDTNNAFEIGLGTYASSGNTITRTTVLTSSNSNNAVDFGSGSKDVFLTYPADKAVAKDASGDISVNISGQPDANLGDVIVTQLDIQAQGDLRLQDSLGGDYVALQAPSSVASSYTLTFPLADGSAGQVIKTNGSGQLSFVDQPVVLEANRNKIINGNFDVWQRGTSFSASGYGADRWRSYYTGGTTTVFSQQSFTLGQTDVPDNPEFYARLVVTSDSTSDSRASFNQKIEDVRTFAGQTVTVSFWAKANATKDLAIELLQYFGTGGSPSSYVTATPQKFSISSTWTQYTKTFSVPSISGKTLGTDNNDYIDLAFWMDAGSDYNSRTSSLGNQSGTFEFAQVQIEKGDTATQFEHKRIGEIKRECYRYYQLYSRRSGTYNMLTIGRAYSSNSGTFRFHIAEEMRTAPSISFNSVGNLNIYSITNPNSGGGGAGTITAISASGTYGPNHVQFGATTSGALTASLGYMIELNNAPSDDQLIFDAEL